jgi:hypothetical protein
VSPNMGRRTRGRPQREPPRCWLLRPVAGRIDWWNLAGGGEDGGGQPRPSEWEQRIMVHAIQDFLKQHWLNVLPLAAFTGITWGCLALGDPRRTLCSVVLALIGLGVFVASEALSEYMDVWGGFFRHLSPRPAWFYRVIGGLLLAWSFIEMFPL